MEKILFDNVTPHVFLHQEDLPSDIWRSTPTFQKGKLYLVEAESGKGKSTFCSYILGYRHDYEGRVMFDSTPASQFRVAQWTELRKRHLACLFQELRLFPELTAWENVEIKNRLTGFKTHQQILQWFERLGIADKTEQKLAHMSFGQQQRVALMRALCQPFDFLLADEPISHLDDRNAQIMAAIIVEEAAAQGAAAIITSIGKHMNMNYDKTYKL